MGFIAGTLVGLFIGFCLGIYGYDLRIKEKIEVAQDLDELKKWL